MLLIRRLPSRSGPSSQGPSSQGPSSQESQQNRYTLFLKRPDADERRVERERAASDLARARALTPKVRHQPGVLAFDVWREKYSYFIDCIWENMVFRLGGGNSGQGPSRLANSLDWDGMRISLERYLYATSSTRFKSFKIIK